MQTIRFAISLLLTLSLLSARVGPAQAEHDQQIAPGLKPPFTLNIIADGNEIYSETPDCAGCSRWFSNLAFLILSNGSLNLEVAEEGAVAASVQQVPESFNAELLKEHQFDFTGTYQAGNLDGVITFSQVLSREEWLCAQTIQGEANLSTTEPISADKGGGTISGWFEATECLSKAPETQRFEFEFNWKALPVCECSCDRQDSKAQFNSLSGTVEITCNPDEVDWEATNLDTKIFVNDHIATRKNSSAIIQFSDSNTFIMKPETEIIIASPPETATKIQLVFGRLWNNTKKLLYEGRMEIETSQAVLGIKGTTFVIEHTGDQTTLKVIAGTVAFSSKATGETVDVHAGEMATAQANGLSDVSSVDITAEQTTWLEFADAEILTPSETVQTLEPASEAASSSQSSGDTGAENQKPGGNGGLCGSIAVIFGGIALIARRPSKPDPCC